MAARLGTRARAVLSAEGDAARAFFAGGNCPGAAWQGLAWLGMAWRGHGMGFI